jgi:SAM-dependent methyltransferase
MGMTVPEQPAPRSVGGDRSASGARAEGGYALGHDEPELARLEHQARLLEPATVTILRLAGVGPGMRVLDVGTGLGDVAFAAAELVGSAGAVVGIDQESRVLESAQRRAVCRGLDNVTFEQGDAKTWRASHRFDAIVGRLVLLYCPDPAAVIRHQCASLSSGGVYVAMEFDMPVARAEPSCVSVAQTRAWVIEAFRRGGMNPALGARLGSVLRLAGLAKPVVLGLQSYLDPADGARFLAGIAATLLPLMERTGVASAAEVNISTLQSRLEAEMVAAGSVMLPPTLVGAWATNPT